MCREGGAASLLEGPFHIRALGCSQLRAARGILIVSILIRSMPYKRSRLQHFKKRFLRALCFPVDILDVGTFLEAVPMSPWCYTSAEFADCKGANPGVLCL